MGAAAKLIGAALALAAVGALADGDTQPPVWGGTAQWSSTVQITNPADSKTFPQWKFDYYYDAVEGADKYFHYGGNGDEVCTLSKVQSRPGGLCEVLNAADGKSYVTDIASGKCCVVKCERHRQ